VISAGDIIAILPKDIVKAKDITSGLKSINSLFEVSGQGVPAIQSEISGRVEIEYKQSFRVVKVINPEGTAKKYKVGYDKMCLVVDGEDVLVGAKITEGAIDPRSILNINGVLQAEQYVIEQLLKIYKFHNITIHPKHLEIIVRQMLSKVSIADPGDTKYIVGDIANRVAVLQENKRLQKEGKKEILFDPLLLGISRVSKISDSFLSATSFQDTTRLLSHAALYGQRDTLQGMKGNVMLGKRIPAKDMVTRT